MGRRKIPEEEKKAKRAEYQKKYWKKWSASLTDKQTQKRKEQPRKSHDKWVQAHKTEWNAYMREYRKRKKEEKIKEESRGQKGNT